FPYILANAIDDKFHVYTVSKLEIYSRKINALLSRTQIRDLYDLHRIIKHQQIEKEDFELLKSLVIVYKLISNKDEKIEFDIHHIDLLTKGTYVRQLLPVLKKGDKFDMDLAKSAVKLFLKDLLDFNSNQKRFIDLANDGVFDFGLLFIDRTIIEKANNHPMILWKLGRNNSMKN
ncbi:MAG: nucleotidyl transferase AbiEii/AbiGii toxin family protein, partial [Firmicutes bacterium]|nr:nucleotidyl transferase AbiEii/AbiGii toxin family protein [Bacillota bacterium]